MPGQCLELQLPVCGKGMMGGVLICWLCNPSVIMCDLLSSLSLWLY